MSNTAQKTATLAPPPVPFIDLSNVKKPFMVDCLEQFQISLFKRLELYRLGLCSLASPVVLERETLNGTPFLKKSRVAFRLYMSFALRGDFSLADRAMSLFSHYLMLDELFNEQHTVFMGVYVPAKGGF